MKHLMISLLIFAMCACAEVISTKNGAELTVDKLSFSNSRFQLDTGELERDQVQKIYFTRQDKQTAGEVAAIDGKSSSEPFVKPFTGKLGDIQALAADALAFQKNYPDVDSLVLRDCGQNLLFENGERTYIYHRAMKILKENAILNNLQFFWEEDRDRMTFYLVRVISPEGSVQYPQSSDISVSTPADEGADFISQGKMITIALPKVTVGSIIEYIYEEYTYNPFNRDFFFPAFGFEDNVPVRLSSLDVVIPTDKELYWAPLNMDRGSEPRRRTDEQGKHFYWEVRNSAPIINEPKMPDYYDIAKRVKCSTMKDWNGYFAWEKKMAEERMVLTPFLEEETKKIISGCQTQEEMLASIYHWLQQNIRYISIKSGIASGMSGHPAEMTFKNKFGDCIDKAILMATMLKVAGIEAYPVALNTKPGAARDLRIPNFGINHAINAVYLNGTRLTLDSTATTQRYPTFREDDQGVWIENYFKGEFYKTELPKPSDNCFRKYQIITVDMDESARIYYRTSYTGSYESGARGYWMYRREDMWEDELRSMITQDYPDAKLLRYKISNAFDISKPFSRELYWSCPEVMKKSGNYRVMDFKNSQAFEETSLLCRRYPILYNSSSMEKYEYHVKLPSTLKVKQLPENVSLSNKYANFWQDYRLTKGGFTFSMALSFKEDFVPVSDYQMYREFTKKVEDCFQKVVFLEEVGGGK
ncbi:MAG: DUF3857 domain-containing transglutaminase family protein [Candidatus Wallbacteria bacterium]|nr:DUF3857 domain-containing transglutaminase family protein [Candidatus Wallbacteria bacterium]